MYLATSKGLIARSFIHKGTHILFEYPYLIQAYLLTHDGVEGKIAGKMKGLPEGQQQHFLGHRSRYTAIYPLTGNIRSNVLPFGEEPAIGDIYTITCRINHSCHPNTHNN